MYTYIRNKSVYIFLITIRKNATTAKVLFCRKEYKQSEIELLPVTWRFGRNRPMDPVYLKYELPERKYDTSRNSCSTSREPHTAATKEHFTALCEAPIEEIFHRMDSVTSLICG
jgi:hypothetical protein